MLKNKSLFLLWQRTQDHHRTSRTDAPVRNNNSRTILVSTKEHFLTSLQILAQDRKFCLITLLVLIIWHIHKSLSFGIHKNYLKSPLYICYCGYWMLVKSVEPHTAAWFLDGYLWGLTVLYVLVLLPFPTVLPYQDFPAFLTYLLSPPPGPSPTLCHFFIPLMFYTWSSLTCWYTPLQTCPLLLYLLFHSAIWPQ